MNYEAITAEFSGNRRFQFVDIHIQPLTSIKRLTSRVNGGRLRVFLQPGP